MECWGIVFTKNLKLKKIHFVLLYLNFSSLIRAVLFYFVLCPFPSSRFRPPADPKSPPLYYYEISKIFLKASTVPMYTNFFGGGGGGECAPEKTQFFGQNYPKCLKRLLWPVFFSKFCLRRIKLGQNRVFLMLWESSENQFGQPKKSRANFRKFLKTPLEKTLYPSLHRRFLFLSPPPAKFNK